MVRLKKIQCMCEAKIIKCVVCVCEGEGYDGGWVSRRKGGEIRVESGTLWIKSCTRVWTKIN